MKMSCNNFNRTSFCWGCTSDIAKLCFSDIPFIHEKLIIYDQPSGIEVYYFSESPNKASKSILSAVVFPKLVRLTVFDSNVHFEQQASV